MVDNNKVDKMYTYLKGYCDAKKYANSLVALPFAREAHEGQFRLGNDPYIIHPLGVALYGINIGFDEDEYIAISLLHDTIEDCHSDLSNLNISDNIKQNVKILSFYKNALINKKIALELYYQNIAESKEATFVKLLDRYNNLSTMASSFTLEKIIKYTLETKELVYPLLEIAKEKYPDKRIQTNILRENIHSLINTTEGMLEFIPENERKRERIKKTT